MGCWQFGAPVSFSWLLRAHAAAFAAPVALFPRLHANGSLRYKCTKRIGGEDLHERNLNLEPYELLMDEFVLG